MIVPREKALLKLTHHQFVMGLGYINHGGAPALGAEHKGDKNCAPPKDTKNGSLHVLQPPGNAPPLTMRWVAGENAWASLKIQKGNRMAWTAPHLSRAGWQYVSIAKA